MEFRDVQEAATAWGVSARLVQRLCAEGRVPGARKIGRSWAIPPDVEKPADPRTASEEGGSASRERGSVEGDARRIVRRPAPDSVPCLAFSNLMPLMSSSFAPGSCRETIEGFKDPNTRAVAYAEFCYFSGRAEEAARIAGERLSHPDLAVRLSACLIYAYANLPLGNIRSARFALEELRIALRKSGLVSSDQSRSMEAFTAYAASVLLHLPAPDDLPPVSSFSRMLPFGVRLFALYVRAHQLYLQGEYARSLGVVEAALLSETGTYPIPEIYLRLVAVMDCMSLKQTDAAREHLLAAWQIARPDGLIEAFGEHHGLLGGMLESVIKKDWPEDFKRIIDVTYRFSAGWRRIHNSVTEETVADNLTTTEFAVSMLAARGWTNREIGVHLDVSANTVKSYLASSYRKLGISRRQDLGRFMLR